MTAPDPGEFVIVERATGQVAGSGALARKRGPWELSFQLRRAFWGRGYAFEAVLLIRDWFFQHTTENLLIAATQSANQASRQLLRRAGARFTGTFEQYNLEQQLFEFTRDRPGAGRGAR